METSSVLEVIEHAAKLLDEDEHYRYAVNGGVELHGAEGRRVERRKWFNEQWSSITNEIKSRGKAAQDTLFCD